MPTRSLLSYVLVLLGGFFAGSRLVAAAQAWREWHRWAVADPSAADLYQTDFWVECATAGLIIGVTYVVYRLLRLRV